MFDVIMQSRRSFLGKAAVSIVAADLALIGPARASYTGTSRPSFGFAQVRQIKAGVLDIGYAEAGPTEGPPVLLLHGFPYSVDSYADVAPLLVARGCRVIVPYLRGHGPTRFLDDGTPRSGQQGALGVDVIALMDALQLNQAVLAGYDWGGRAACVAAALWPERCTGLVSVNI
jgi:pimeloyl-ACP methyl ester carboxylesterase